MDIEDLYAYIFKQSIFSNREIKNMISVSGNFSNLISGDLCAEQLGDAKLYDKYICEIQKIKKDLNAKLDKSKMFYSDLIKRKIKWSLVTDEDYPSKLFSIPDPPTIIYYLGNLPKEDCISVAIIGARQCSDYGYKCATLFSECLSEAGVQIISGMARGVDGVSQRKAIETGGSTFGILGNGVDIVYPKENDDIFADICENGGLISEYEPGIPADKRHFPARNRIISALSDVILVIEAREKSGTLITVNQALEQGKEVYAVPGKITDNLSSGCNMLISEGAAAAISPQRMLSELGISFGSFPEHKAENKILELLSIKACTISALYENLSEYYDYNELLLQVSELEISGLVGRRGDLIFQI